MTLAYGKVLKDPVIGQIAQRHNATPAQVALAWALQRGFAVIPSSTKRENLASNLLARDLRLTDADMAQIAALERKDVYKRQGERRPGTCRKACPSPAANRPAGPRLRGG